MSKTLGFIKWVDGRDVEYDGVSHAVSEYAAGRGGPVVACGADTSSMNWTVNPTARTRICYRCLETIMNSYMLVNDNPGVMSEEAWDRDITLGRYVAWNHGKPYLIEPIGERGYLVEIVCDGDARALRERPWKRKCEEVFAPYGNGTPSVFSPLIEMNLPEMVYREIYRLAMNNRGSGFEALEANMKLGRLSSCTRDEVMAAWTAARKEGKVPTSWE